MSLPDPDFGGAPPLLRRLAANVLGGSVPIRSRVVALRAGPALLLLSPAEPVEAVGRAWREGAGEGAEAVSLAGDYRGYVETPQRTKAGLGEAKRSYYGPSLAYLLGDALVLAAWRRRRREPRLRDDPQSRRTRQQYLHLADSVLRACGPA